MSLKEIQDDLNKVIKPQLEEILNLLNKMQAQDITENIEAAAAKVIIELKPLVQDYKETLQALQQEEPTGKIDDSPTDEL